MIFGAKKISQKNKSKQKYVTFLNASFHTTFLAFPFVRHWKQPFIGVPHKTGLPKKFENVLSKSLKNNCKTDIFSAKA